MAPNTTAGVSADHPESEMSAINSGSQKRSCYEESPRERKISRKESGELEKDLELSDDDSGNDSDCSYSSSHSCKDYSTCGSGSSFSDDKESKSGSSSLDTDRSKCSLEKNSVNESPRESNIIEDSEELFKDFELSDDYADGSSTRSCSCKSRCFCDNRNSSDDEDSSSDDEDSRSDLDEQTAHSSLTFGSFIINLQSDSSSSDSEEELDEEARFVLDQAYLKLSAIRCSTFQLRKYLLLTRIKDRVLESIRVIW